MGTSSVLGGKARAERRGRRWARLDMFELVVRFPHTGARPVGSSQSVPQEGALHSLKAGAVPPFCQTHPGGGVASQRRRLGT